LYSILRQLRVLRAQVRTDIAFVRPHVVEPVRATLENLMKRATAEKVIQGLVAVSGTLNETVSASRSAWCVPWIRKTIPISIRAAAKAATTVR